MSELRTLSDLDVAGRKVLVRLDLNVPISGGRVSDDSRIVAAIPTLEYLLERDAALILCSHLGRPKGKPDPKLSLRPVAERLTALLNRPVQFVGDSVGPKARAAAAELQSGQLLLLENTRFHPGEVANDPEFARRLAELAELYVNDAFGSAHRAHASTEGVAQLLPGAAGLLIEKELQYLGSALQKPERPYLAVLGGAKISDKIGVIRALLERTDEVLIGGGMANTFLAARGFPMADSLVESEAIDQARQLLERGGDKLQLPSDLVVADAFSKSAARKVVDVVAVPAGWRALDIGPRTVQRYSLKLATAKTVVWNGPMGVFEFGPFAAGTFAIAHTIARTVELSIVGGGDTVAAVQTSGVRGGFSHLSTGGGAALALLEGKTLPGLAALEK